MENGPYTCKEGALDFTNLLLDRRFVPNSSLPGLLIPEGAVSLKTALTAAGNVQGILTETQLGRLTLAMEIIQDHFEGVYGRRGDATFAMNIEFKVDARGGLVVKQARPRVE